MNHTALRTAGPFAHDIAQLFWLFAVVAAVVYVLVIGALLYALWRRRAQSGELLHAAPPRTAVRLIGASVGLTGVVLVGLALADFFGNRALASVPADALHVRITAYQWWWEVEYTDAAAANRVTTANHLVIPVGRPVMLELGSRDVIHSLWVPSLQGKKDLIPGYTTSLALLAARAGTYTGECAEFCGFQHAHMSIDVSAVSTAEFTRWLDAQRAEAAEPVNDEQRRGRDVYLASSCRGCHAIQGTTSAARLGPDLTHLASRPRIAAGTLPNDRASLAAWISDPQSIKPGTRMPATELSADDLGALTAYLGNLR
jgi:cytochrome c oxidase subunit II